MRQRKLQIFRGQTQNEKTGKVHIVVNVLEYYLVKLHLLLPVFFYFRDTFRLAVPVRTSMTERIGNIRAGMKKLRKKVELVHLARSNLLNSGLKWLSFHNFLSSYARRRK